MDDIRLLFYPLMPANALMKRDDFAVATTQQLYTLFGELIAAYPEQWEGWLTIHRHVKLINCVTDEGFAGSKKGENLLFNAARFGIFKTGGMPFLLDKHRYLFYPLSDELFELLSGCKQRAIKRTATDDELTDLMLEMGVIMLV